MSEEELTALDFPIELACEQVYLVGVEMIEHTCGQPAQWLSVCTDCGDTAYVCNRHKVLQQAIPLFASQHVYKPVGRA